MPWIGVKDTYTHVDVPGRVGHDDVKFAQDGVVEATNVAVNPLRRHLNKC
jgi:hypothetical protein